MPWISCAPLFAGYIGAIDLDSDGGQRMVLEAARQVPDTDRKACITLMLAVASEAARHAMEAKMATPAYRNDFIESFVAKGEAKGRVEGKAEGKAEGRAETLGAAIMKALAARGIRVDKVRAEQVQSCPDLNQLNEWFDKALTAETADDVFGSLALDCVPAEHPVWVVIAIVGRLATPDLMARLVPSVRRGPATDPDRWDLVMLLTVWLYGCLRGVLSARALEDRCRYDATFRVVCWQAVPDYLTLYWFRIHLLAHDELAEDLFRQFLRACAEAGLGRVRSAIANAAYLAPDASPEARLKHAEAHLPWIAELYVSGGREAQEAEDLDRMVIPGCDLLQVKNTRRSY